MSATLGSSAAENSTKLNENKPPHQQSAAVSTSLSKPDSGRQTIYLSQVGSNMRAVP